MISTKDIPTSGGGIQKTLQPGNQTIKINSIYLEEYPYEQGALFLRMDCEGPDLGEGFEGFFIDKDNESLGRYKGQVGKVRTNRWWYQDKDLGSVQINRDVEIVKMLKNICEVTGCEAWLESQDGKHETVESLVAKFNEDAPFADVFFKACLGGKEYENKGGYINYDLHFVKYVKEGTPIEKLGVDESQSRLIKYNEAEHIVKRKVDQPVDSFERTQDFTI